jgi:hypothetical protein
MDQGALRPGALIRGNTMIQEDAKGGENVRSERYILAHTRRRCEYCGAETNIVALALPPRHESLTLDWMADRDESADYVWESAASCAFLFYVESLPVSVQRRLSAISSGYRHAFCETTLGSYWANHCEACGRMLDEHELFCEPEGAFVPTSAIAAAAIRLIQVDEPIGARVAGYAVEPQFLEFMSAG